MVCVCVCVYICVCAHTHTDTHNGMLLSDKKEWIFAICNNMYGSGGYYIYWNKSERERWLLYVTTYMKNLKNKLMNITKEESQM